MKKHVVMRFSFSGVHAAYKFRDFLQTCNLPAHPEFRLGIGWQIKTTTECFAFSESITRFLSHRENRDEQGAA
jgi:hypothetical protein